MTTKAKRTVTWSVTSVGAVVGILLGFGGLKDCLYKDLTAHVRASTTGPTHSPVTSAQIVSRCRESMRAHTMEHGKRHDEINSLLKEIRDEQKSMRGQLWQVLKEVRR